MKHVLPWTVVTAFVIGIFETAILSHIQFLPALPDLMLVLVVYIALYNGSLVGVTAGFFSGLIFDFLSLAPFGLHSFIFTLLGFLCGLLYRRYNVRRFFFPLVLGLSATLLKAVLLFALRFLFGRGIQVYDALSLMFWFEVAANAFCAPLFFALFGLFPAAFSVQEL